MWNYQPRKTCGKNAKYRQKELTRYDKFATIISKQASRNTALYRGEYNKIQVHCCIDVFYGAVRFCFYKKQKTQLLSN